MESAAPFTRDFHPLGNAHAEHTKKSAQLVVLQLVTLTLAEREGFYTTLPPSVTR